jgi:branched-chain amino acid aminotransferase
VSKDATVLTNNRAFLYGDGVFETIKILNNKILFLEDHYFRLMSSMRVVRMEIPMNFTMEFFEEQVLKLILELPKANSFRVRCSFFRIGGGFYLPKTNDVAFIITAELLQTSLYGYKEAPYEVDLFKDAYITKQLLSTLKSNNKLVQITGSIFANENDYDNCLLLNDEKNIVEALQGNIFMFKDNQLTTPPILDGCLNGIMRKQILAIAQKMEGFEVFEKSISPFDLQKADELFITNVIQGIQPITKYRKKEYTTNLSKQILDRLNARIRLN